MDKNERVRVLRKELGLTMEEFGKRLGVGKSAISGIENGNRGLTDQMAVSICREFGISETWLKTGEGEKRVQLSEHELINQRMARIQLAAMDATDEEKRDFALFKERMASAILNISDEGAAAIIELLKDMGYIKNED